MAPSIHSKTARRSVSWSWVLSLVIALGALSPAYAADEAQKRKARAHFKQGRAYQDAGSYPEAVKEYEAAYALLPEPELLFNIGQAYRLGGDKKKAIEYYKRYLEREPDGRGADQASAHIAKLSKELDKEKKAPPPVGKKPEKKPEAVVEKKPAAEKKPPDKKPVEKKPVAVASADKPPLDPPETSTSTTTSASTSGASGDTGIEEGTEGRGLRWGGIATAGVGVVGIGLGFYFMSRVSKLEKEGNAIIDEMMTWDPKLEDIERRGKAAERNMIISFVAGGAALATGGLLYYLGAKDAEAAIAVAPGEGHVVVFLRF